MIKGVRQTNAAKFPMVGCLAKEVITLGGADALTPAIIEHVWGQDKVVH